MTAFHLDYASLPESDLSAAGSAAAAAQEAQLARNRAMRRFAEQWRNYLRTTGEAAVLDEPWTTSPELEIDHLSPAAQRARLRRLSIATETGARATRSVAAIALDSMPADIDPMPLWKRCVDLVGACCGLLLLAPLMLLVALTIKITSRGPIIFSQPRAGLNGVPFTLFKFRTMVVDADERKSALRAMNEQDGPVFKIRNDPRFTPIGRFLRRTSLDELPQLWNVLKGQMSLVGPRPLVLDESNACNPLQRRRLEVVPGMTCIWQARGRSNVSFDQWMIMDLTYVHARSLLVDTLILLQTIPAVIARRGAL